MKKLKIKQVRSRIGKHKKVKRTLEALGLKKIGQIVYHDDTPQIRGMIKVVEYVVEVEEVEEDKNV